MNDYGQRIRGVEKSQMMTIISNIENLVLWARSEIIGCAANKFHDSIGRLKVNAAHWGEINAGPSVLVFFTFRDQPVYRVKN